MAVKTTSINYEQIFDQIPVQYIVFGVDLPRFTILAVSDKYLESVGRTRKIIGEPAFEIFPDTSARAKKTGKGLIQGSIENVIKTKKLDSLGVVRYDIPTENDSMEVRYWKVTHHPIVDKKGTVTGVVQINTDVTESVLSDEKLKLAELQLDEALSAGLIGSWIWDAKKDIVIADKGLAFLFGIAPKTAQLGIPIEVFVASIHPDDKERVINAIARVMKKGNTYESEYRTIDKKGVVRWVIARGRIERNEKGEAVRIPGVLVDITERKEAEEKLRESEQQLRFMADAMPQLVFSTDETGMPNYYNEQWYKFTGIDSKKVEDVAWDKLFHPRDLDLVYSSYTSSIKSGEPFNVEFRLWNAPTKKYRWVIGRALPFKDEEGKYVKWYGTLTDINDQKRLERELKREKLSLETRVTERTAQLEETNRGLHAEILKRQEVERSLSESNRTKDEFISIASHQLRTPATGVKQYLGMLLEGFLGEFEENQKEILSKAYQSNERQLRIVADLLKVAQVDGGKVMLRKTSANIDDVVADIVNEQSAVFSSRRQRVVFTPVKAGHEALIDKDNIRMVLENIIDNASKYSLDTTKISIGVKANDSFVTVTVSDEGVGVDKHDSGRLFEKFSRIHNELSTKVGGTGLGLYWAKKIVDLHDGKIKYSPTKEGSGSTFAISLPRREL